MSASGLRALAVVLLVWPASAAPAGMAAADRLLPPSTRGFLSCPDARRLEESWAKTSFSALWNDPAMKEFRTLAAARLDKGEVIVPILFGLTPADVREAATGEVAVGLVHEAKGPPNLVLLIDVTGNTAKADLVLERVGRRLASAGATRTAETTGGEKVAVLALPEGLRLRMLQRCCFLRKGDCLVASSSVPEIQAVLGRLAGTTTESLAGVHAYEETSRVRKELREVHLRGFVEPLAFAKAVRAFWGEESAEKPDRLQVLEKEGFGALRGLQWAASLSAGEDEVQVRAYLHAPGPLQRAARMLDFPNAEPADPPAWVPRQVGRCFSLSANFRKAFDAYATLFDALYGDGERGVFDDLVKGTRDDPEGPRVDIRRDILAPLRQPLWAVTLRPEKAGRLRWLQGVALSQEKPFAPALRRLLEGDEQVKRLPFGDYGAWKILSEKELPKPKKDRKAWSMPPSTLAVARRTFFLAESPDLLPLVLREEDPLAKADDYVAMNRRLVAEVGKAACVRGFLRNEEDSRDFWDEMRSGKMPAEGWQSRVMKKFLVSKGDRERPPFDTKALPAFDLVRKHADTRTGLAAVTRDKGWSLLLVVPRKGK